MANRDSKIEMSYYKRNPENIICHQCSEVIEDASALKAIEELSVKFKSVWPSCTVNCQGHICEGDRTKAAVKRKAKAHPDAPKKKKAKH